jgi:hypothetical protein
LFDQYINAFPPVLVILIYPTPPAHNLEPYDMPYPLCNPMMNEEPTPSRADQWSPENSDMISEKLKHEATETRLDSREGCRTKGKGTANSRGCQIDEDDGSLTEMRTENSSTQFLCLDDTTYQKNVSLIL